MDIQQLPNDSINEILYHLPFKESVSFSLTCKKYKDVLKEVYIHGKIQNHLIKEYNIINSKPYYAEYRFVDEDKPNGIFETPQSFLLLQDLVWNEYKTGHLENKSFDELQRCLKEWTDNKKVTMIFKKDMHLLLKRGVIKRGRVKGWWVPSHKGVNKCIRYLPLFK